MKEIRRIELEEMPLDMVFNGELCHATGYIVQFEGDNTYWYEYVDSDNEYHYGR